VLDGPRLAPASGNKPVGLVVLLHGYGSNGADLISLAAMIQPSLPDLAFVAPNAPAQLPQMANAHQWWPIESFSAGERAAGALAAAPGVDAFLTRELLESGLADNRLLLVGFSQGAMLALHVGLRRAKPLAAIVGISGMLVAPEQLSADIRSRPPVLLVHGTEDQVVPFRSLELSAKALDAAGVPTQAHISPGIGHSVDQGGLEKVAAFARRVLA
jgi:phospholipase/carboxylesterase